jgi:hypothetical protein
VQGISQTMARPQPLDWKHEVIGRRYRMGEEHPEFKGWYFSGQYTYDGRALWMRPDTPSQKWLSVVGWVAVWMVGVLMVMVVASMLFGKVVPVLMEPR